MAWPSIANEWTAATTAIGGGAEGLGGNGSEGRLQTRQLAV